MHDVTWYNSVIQTEFITHYCFANLFLTRISGPYRPLKILAPAESWLASLARVFSRRTPFGMRDYTQWLVLI